MPVSALDSTYDLHLPAARLLSAAATAAFASARARAPGSGAAAGNGLPINKYCSFIYYLGKLKSTQI